MPVDDDYTWHDAQSFDIEGQGWSLEALHTRYDRLPREAEPLVPEAVWELSRLTAGLLARFSTNAETIRARWTLGQPERTLDHMPMSGSAGLDLYANINGIWRWAGVGRPKRHGSAEQEDELVCNLLHGEKTFHLYFPLFNTIEKLEIGIPRSATIAPAPKRQADKSKPVVYYGTSIVHGACASRPGMTYPAQIERRLNRPAINLGFAGNARMEESLALLLAQLDPAAFVIDPLPNMNAEQVAERAERFITILHEARPQTPIILVENIAYPSSAVKAPGARGEVAKNAALQKVFITMRDACDGKLALVPSQQLLGVDGEATVDGTHPTDLGFRRMADVIEPYVRRAVDGFSAASAGRAHSVGRTSLPRTPSTPRARTEILR